MTNALQPKPRRLFITHALGGGTERHVEDLIDLLAPHIDIDVLRPVDVGTVGLQDSAGQTAYLDASDWPRLARILRSRRYCRMHLHHIHGFSAAIFGLPSQLGLAYDLTLHDFYPFCPQYALATGAGEYCGEPDVEGCSACVARRPHILGWSIERWRQTMGDFVDNAARIIAPSHFLAQRIERHFPTVSVRVIAHPPRAQWLSPIVSPKKILLLGGLTDAKGLVTLLACASDARDRALPLSFRLLGYPERAVPQYPDLPIQIAGEYADADLPSLVSLERCDAIWFAGRIPESYSYTLDVALASGLPIVATDIGAIAERLAHVDCATLLHLETPPDAWNDALLEAAATQRAPEEPGQTRDYAASIRRREAYRQFLLEPLESGDATALMPGEISAQAVETVTSVEPAPAKELSLAALYEHGVECGHRETRMAFKRKLAEIEKTNRVLDSYTARHGKPWYELLHDAVANEARARAVRDQMRQQIDELLRQRAADQCVIEHLRGELRQFECSTSWRVTAPLRSATLASRRLLNQGRRLSLSAGKGFRRLPAEATGAGDEAGASQSMPVGRESRGAAALADAELLTIGPLSLQTCPGDSTPLVSIVIPVYGQHAYTFNCLLSLAQHTDLSDVEVIVVDDASDEPATVALNEVEGVRIEENPVNLGFIGSCHRGASLARGDYLVFLNNDVKVRAGWLNALIDVFKRWPDAGLVGARLIYPDGRLQEAGGSVWKDGTAGNWGSGGDPDLPAYCYVRAADYCSGACLAIRHSDWEALGGFDRAYEPAYYEDTDLAFRVRAAGKRVYYQPGATIIHYEGVSSGTDETQGVKRYQVINRDTFYERWKPVLQHHRDNGIAPRLEADRGARARVLIVEACFITPDQDSGSVRMQAILELLVELGCKVSFVADNLEYREPYASVLQQFGVEIWHSPHVGSVEDLLEQHGAEYDLIVFCRHYVAARYVHRVRQWAPQAKIVFDTVDLHYLREQREADLKQSAALRADAAETRSRELDVIANVDMTLVVSPVEKDILSREAPESSVRILSNIHVPRAPGKAFEHRRGLLFVGGFRHLPNVDAMQWFVSEVWPLVRRELVDIELTIVGSNMPDDIRALEQPGVHVLGFVEDIEPLLESARVSLAPMRYGAGVKGKVNQAMAWGLPVVATSVAAEGMQLEHEREILIADAANDFAAATIRLHGDGELWNRLADQGRINVERYFSRAAARKMLAQLLGFPDD